MITLIIFAALSPPESPALAADRLYQEGKFPEAAAAYAELAETPAIAFNRGCALFSAKKYDEAVEAFRTAAAGPADVAARARFNLGHALLRQAAEPPQAAPTSQQTQGGSPGPSEPSAPAHPDPERMLATLRRSAAAFRSVLDVDPTDSEAARNTELVRRMIRQLEQQMQEAQQKQQQMQEQADKLDQLADRQQQQAEQSRKTPPSKSDQQQQEQQKLNEQTQQALDEMQQQMGDQPEAQQAAQQMQEAMKKQAESMQDLNEQRPDRAAEDQQQAADNLREAAQKLRDAAQQQQPGQPQDQQNQQQSQDQQQQAQSQQQEPKSEAEKLAEQILQSEQAQREARERSRRLYAVPVPVEKDW